MLVHPRPHFHDDDVASARLTHLSGSQFKESLSTACAAHKSAQPCLGLGAGKVASFKYSVYWFLCVEPSLHSKGEAYLVMICDLSHDMLRSVCQHLVEDVCNSVH